MRISDFGTVELCGMEFHAYHGCLPEEQRNGNTFLVDFRGEYDLKKAARSDALEDAIDYGAVYAIIASEMEKPSKLLENVAGRILDAIVRKYDFLIASVTVYKKNPPVGGVCAWSRVTVNYGD